MNTVVKNIYIENSARKEIVSILGCEKAGQQDKIMLNFKGPVKLPSKGLGLFHIYCPTINEHSFGLTFSLVFDIATLNSFLISVLPRRISQCFNVLFSSGR